MESEAEKQTLEEGAGDEGVGGEQPTNPTPLERRLEGEEVGAEGGAHAGE